MRYDDEPLNFEEVAQLQHLDEQIEARLYGNTSARPDGQDALDPELLRDLHNFYQPRAQAFQSGLDRVWSRLEQRGVTSAEPRQLREKPILLPGLPEERRRAPQRIFRTTQNWASRASALVAAVLLVVLIGGLVLGLILVRQPGNGTPSAPQPQATTTPTAIATATPSLTPFSVSSVDLVVSPDSIAGKSCGSSITLTYTATFYITPGGPGGTIQFAYTLNNGRSSTNASVIASPGQTTQTYSFTSSGTLPADHTYPGIAEVLVTSPNSVQSPQVQPAGTCGAAAVFQVTSVDLAVSPTSIAGMACGTQTTVTYTATFHIAAGGPGGTIHFAYTVNNGRGQSSASVPVAAGQTAATYSFTWSGNLPSDHTYPGEGGVMVTSPNQVTSPMVAPTGSCS